MQAATHEPTPAPAPAATSEADLNRLAGAIDRALEGVAKLDDDDRLAANRLKDAVEDLQKHVLTTIVRRLKSDPRGKELLFELVDDPAVRMAFAMHGIIKADVTTRAARAIEEIRPYAHSHGGDVELVEVRDRVAYVRLHGTCNGCSMSSVTLQKGVREALAERVPEIEGIEVVEDQEASGPTLIPLESVDLLDEKGWVEGPAAEAVEAGRMYHLEGEADGAAYDVILVRLDDGLHAYRNACAHQGRPLDRGHLDGDTVVCPWHGFRFDLTSGECMTVPHAQLEPFPLRVEEGVVWVRPS
jgi:nitrite reductase/ring-hydroxylating ferredoxin subunit/Fe-S cluster biogenesis protein NfuA